MTEMSSLNPAPDPKPNTSREPIRKKRSTKEKLERDYPSFRRQEAQRVALKGEFQQEMTERGMALRRVGLTEADITGIPSITKRVVSAMGSVREAIELLSEDDSPDSIQFTAKWNSLGERDKKALHLEDVIVATGITTRRFIELIAGATSDHSDFIFKALANQKRQKVLESTIKAATDEESADVKAMELFFKLTKDIQPSGITLNSNNQTANLNVAPDRPPLQTMDSWLLEIDDIRKPKQLSAVIPIIPVEMPENAPEIEYLDIGE